MTDLSLESIEALVIELNSRFDYMVFQGLQLSEKPGRDRLYRYLNGEGRFLLGMITGIQHIVADDICRNEDFDGTFDEGENRNGPETKKPEEEVDD